MNVSLSWLKQYVDIPVDTATLVHDLTMLGLNVEHATSTGLDEPLVVIGHVLDRALGADPRPEARGVHGVGSHHGPGRDVGATVAGHRAGHVGRDRQDPRRVGQDLALEVGEPAVVLESAVGAGLVEQRGVDLEHVGEAVGTRQAPAMVLALLAAMERTVLD